MGGHIFLGFPISRILLHKIQVPPILIPFIVCIEIIRNIIRPGTLAVRLTAIIIAGHLLISLLGNTGPPLFHLIFSFVHLFHFYNIHGSEK